MHTRAVVLLGLAWALCPSGAIGEAAPAPPSLSGLLNENRSLRQKTLCDLVQARSDYIKNVLALAEREDLDKTEGGPVCLAIMLLGKLRAIEAVPFLSSRIAYLPPLRQGVFMSDEMRPMESYYPCAVALAEIGEPCLGVMRHLICLGKTKQERDLAAWVMLQVDGEDVALYRLTALAKKGEPYVKNYEEAKDFIANYKPVFRHPLVPPSQLEPSKPQNPER